MARISHQYKPFSMGSTRDDGDVVNASPNLMSTVFLFFFFVFVVFLAKRRPKTFFEASLFDATII